MPVGSSNQMLQHLNSKVRIILCDNRTFIGRFSAFDKFMNIVLTDGYEYKHYKPKGKEIVKGKRTLGTIIVRGEHITSVILEGGGSSSRYSSSGSYRH